MLSTLKLRELSGIGTKDVFSHLGILLVSEQPAGGGNLLNHVMNMFPVSLKPHSDLEGISLCAKGVPFARLYYEEQNRLFSGCSESMSSPRQVIRSILDVNPRKWPP